MDSNPQLSKIPKSNRELLFQTYNLEKRNKWNRSAFFSLARQLDMNVMELGAAVGLNRGTVIQCINNDRFPATVAITLETIQDFIMFSITGENPVLKPLDMFMMEKLKDRSISMSKAAIN